MAAATHRFGTSVALAILVAMITTLGLLIPQSASAQGWLDTNWLYRRASTITNPAGTTLTNHQVRIALTSAFDFTRAKTDGSDLRVTAADGTTLIPFWIEKWDAASTQAFIWVKVPSIPLAGSSVYLYYGNAGASKASSGDNTFEFFDDFDANTAPGYYSLGPAQTVMVRDQGWEGQAPHNLSAVQAPAGAAYPYYGYYGLEGCGGIGISGSNDLVTWTKFPTNPLFNTGGERWPSVILVGGTYYMVHTRDYCGTSNIVLRTSMDGLTWSALTQVVAPVGGQRNQNPNLYRDPIGGQYYLYWFRNDGMYNIMARTASTVEGLVTAPDITLLREATVLAAPNMMYRDGTYFLSTEILESVWKVRVYSGTNPLGPFTVLPGNPVLGDGCACLFQTPIKDTLYEYYCKLTGSTWTLDMRTADLTAPRQQFGAIDPAKWTALGGTWSAASGTQQDGTTGVVAQGTTSTRQMLKSSYSGTDYILDVYGKQTAGRVFGVGVKVVDANNLYSTNLYEDIDAIANLYLYRWSGGGGTTVGSRALGTINLNTWYKLTVKVHGTAIDVHFNDSPTPSVSGTGLSATAGSVALYGETGTTAQFNNVRVRKYASADPVASVGLRETAAAPVISFVAAVPAPNGTTAAITWLTDAPATSWVDYGTSAVSLGSNATSPGLVTSHSVTLTGLTAGLTYYYRVTSANGAGESSQNPVPPATLNLSTPWVDAVSATVSGGACISTAHACLAIPVDFSRYDATPVRAYSVVLRLNGLAACDLKFAKGPYLTSKGSTSFRYIDNLDGTYQVDETILGQPCGVTGSGTLFTLYVGSAAESGTGTITIESVRVRDCDNGAVTGNPGPMASVPIDKMPPAPVTGLTAQRVPGGNGSSGMTRIAITLTPPGDGSLVEVYRKGFGNYPEYDDGTSPGSEPTAPTAYPPAGWTKTAVTASGQTDEPGTRDYWYYVAYSVDACGNATASPRTAGTLNYHLGDVHNSVTDCAGNNLVDLGDLSFLGFHYGALLGESDALACLDVGPTTNFWSDGRPLTDNQVEFEDLILFALNFGTVSQPGLAGRAEPRTPQASSLSLQMPQMPAVGQTFDVVMNLAGGGDVQGLSAKLDYDAAVANPVAVMKGALLAQQRGPAEVFMAKPGVVDVAVFGQGYGLEGAGELARVTFRVKAAGDAAIALGEVKARDQKNRPVTLGHSAPVQGPPLPGQLELAPSYPNPFDASTMIAFGLPKAVRVKLVVFDIQGRAVRHLMDGAAEAGWTRVRWDGRDDGGLALGSGAYVIRLAADGRVITKSVRLVR